MYFQKRGNHDSGYSVNMLCFQQNIMRHVKKKFTVYQCIEVFVDLLLNLMSNLKKIEFNHQNISFSRYKNECDYQEQLRGTLENLNKVQYVIINYL